jgi:hypothetical protein
MGAGGGGFAMWKTGPDSGRMIILLVYRTDFNTATMHFLR